MKTRNAWLDAIALLSSLLVVSCPTPGGGYEAPAEQPTVASVTFSPAGATYSSDQQVTLSTSTAGATIYYTVDSSAPNASSPTYSTPIAVAGNGTTTTIKAYAAKSGMTDSGVTSATYTISYNQTSTPQFQPTAGTYYADQTVTITDSTSNATIYYTTDGTAPTTGSTVYTSEGVVVAFEPLPRNMFLLYRHTELNKARNTVLIPAACSDRTSVASFSFRQSAAEGHLVAAGKETGTIPVLTTTIDEATREIGVSPNVIKIDVEGAELSVLKGARATLAGARPHVLLSTHSESLRDECLAFLADLDFSCTVIGPDKSSPSEFLASPLMKKRT
jgi:FkbM family methyltransferase